MESNFRDSEMDRRSAEEKSLGPYDQSIDEIVKELDKIHGPYWRSQSDLAKLIVSLSSAALVLTVTFSKDLAVNLSNGWKVFLFLSWLSFAVSTVIGIIGLWAFTKFHTVQIMFFNQREQMKIRIAEMKRQDKFKAELFEDLLSAPFFKLKKYEKAAGVAVVVELVLFILALFLLSLFGWRAFSK
jgi:hypothetical protein